MGALIGLVFGLGITLVWAVFFVPRSPRVSAPSPGRVEQLLISAGLRSVSSRSLIFLCLAIALMIGLLVQVISRTIPVAMVFGAMAGYLPVAVVRSRAHKRRKDFAAVWPEAVDHLASAVRAGLSLPEALGQLGTRGPEPLRPAFVSFAMDYQVTGRFSECLDRLKGYLADPVGDRVVEAMRIAREVGGGELGRLLRSLSGYLRDDAHTRSELEARQAWTLSGARLAVAAPWLVLILLCFQPDVIQRYRSAGGVLVLAVGAFLCIFAYWLMMRIGRLPLERRILA